MTYEEAREMAAQIDKNIRMSTVVGLKFIHNYGGLAHTNFQFPSLILYPSNQRTRCENINIKNQQIESEQQ